MHQQLMHDHLLQLFTMQNLPVQQNRIYDSLIEAKKCPCGDMNLVQNLQTGLIYNAAFDKELMEYDENYQNEQSHSEIFLGHLSEVRELLKEHFSHKKMVEIGCGKGRFLELMSDAGFDILGVDPAYDGVSKKVIKSYFTPELDIKAEVIILRHTLEHVDNPVEFLQSIANANQNRGYIYIEVPCFDWILKNNAWFDIFYEHVNYFRMEDFLNIFTELFDIGHLFGGQYLYVIADLNKITNKTTRDIKPVKLPNGFFRGIDICAKKIQESGEKNNVVWGASSKGVIFCHYLAEKKDLFPEFMIDINPVKQNKLAPVTGLNIYGPEKAMATLNDNDNVYVMNSNYLEEIISATNNRYCYIPVDQL